MTSHHDVTGRGYGICGKLLRTFQQIPQPRRLDEIKKSVTKRSGAGGTRSGKLYLLDTGLLMGGTHVAPMQEIRCLLSLTPRGRLERGPRAGEGLYQQSKESFSWHR